MQNISGLFQQRSIFSSMDEFEIPEDKQYVAKGPDICFHMLNAEGRIKLYMIVSSFSWNEID